MGTLLLRWAIILPTNGLGKHVKNDTLHNIFQNLLDSEWEVLYSRFLSAYAGRRKSFLGSLGKKAHKGLDGQAANRVS
nr:hypothetical protein [uncultured Sphaerochaeta sp.]